METIKPTACENSRIIIYNLETQEAKRMPCKSWYCPSCAPKKAAELKKKINKEVSNWSHTRMLTLTLRHFNFEPKKHYKILQEAFRQFLTEIKRIKQLAKKMQQLRYIRVNELTLTGYTHIHTLVNIYMPQEILYKIWNRILKNVLLKENVNTSQQLGSVNIVLIGSNRQAARYATKYIAKSTTEEHYDRTNGEITQREEDPKKRDKKKRPYHKFWSKSFNIAFEKIVKSTKNWAVIKATRHGWQLNSSLFAYLRRNSEEQEYYRLLYDENYTKLKKICADLNRI